ncbi:Origin recognition complex subunit 1 [Venturia inaequalis]|nr:Origin recognition complex subunit 1 [Venturia inaequalis]
MADKWQNELVSVSPRRATHAGHQREGASSSSSFLHIHTNDKLHGDPATKWLEEMNTDKWQINGRELVLASPRRATHAGHQREGASSSSSFLHIHTNDKLHGDPATKWLEEMNTDKWQINGRELVLASPRRATRRRTPREGASSSSDFLHIYLNDKLHGGPATKWLEEMNTDKWQINGEQMANKWQINGRELVLASPRRATRRRTPREGASSSSDFLQVNLLNFN